MSKYNRPDNLDESIKIRIQNLCITIEYYENSDKLNCFDILSEEADNFLMFSSSGSGQSPSTDSYKNKLTENYCNI